MHRARESASVVAQARCTGVNVGITAVLSLRCRSVPRNATKMYPPRVGELQEQRIPPRIARRDDACSCSIRGISAMRALYLFKFRLPLSNEAETSPVEVIEQC